MAFSRTSGFTSLIADDAAATAAGEVTPSRYNLAHKVADAVSGGIPYFSSTTAEGTSALLAANSLVIGGGAGAAPFTSANLTFGAATGEGLVYAAGTATTNVAAFSLTRTNNNSAVVQGVKWTFTDTTSAAGFLPFQILGGSAGTTNLLSVSKTGNLLAAQALSFSDYTASGTTSYGIFRTDTGGGGTRALFDSLTGDTAFIRFNSGSGGTDGFAQLGSGSIGFTFSSVSTNTRNTADTNLSRISAGVIGVGTGTASSVAGKLRAASYSMPNSGGAATVGNAVLVAGTVTVSTTAVQTADIVVLTRKTSGGTLGTAITYTISDATSFTITSDSALDTSTFSWVIVKAH